MYLADKTVAVDGNTVTFEDGQTRTIDARFQPFLLTEEPITEEEFFEKRENVLIAEILGNFRDSGVEFAEVFHILDRVKNNVIVMQQHGFAKSFGQTSSGRVVFRDVFDFIGKDE